MAVAEAGVPRGGGSLCKPYIGLHRWLPVASEYVTVSAKIPKRLKELLDRYGIKPGPVIRRALEEEVRRRRLEELEAKARELAEELPAISDEEVASLIRADRDGR